MNELINKILENGFKYNAVNYWCGNVRIKKSGIKYYGVSSEYYDKIIEVYDVIQYGGVLEIYTEDNVCFELNKDKLLNGIKEYCNTNNIAVNRLMEILTLEDCDIIIQLSLFGFVMF